MHMIRTIRDSPGNNCKDDGLIGATPTLKIPYEHRSLNENCRLSICKNALYERGIV